MLLPSVVLLVELLLPSVELPNVEPFAAEEPFAADVLVLEDPNVETEDINAVIAEDINADLFSLFASKKL